MRYSLPLLTVKVRRSSLLGLLPCVRSRRVPVTLRVQVLLDIVAGVLQQVLVGRSFARYRYERLALARRQHVSGKHQAHARAIARQDRQVRDTIVVNELGVDRQPGLVVAVITPVRDVLRRALVDLVTFERPSGGQTEGRQDLARAHNAVHLDLAHAGALPGSQIEPQRGTVRRMQNFQPRGDRGPEITAGLELVLDEPCGLWRATCSGQAAIAFGHQAPETALIHPWNVRARERHPLDGMHRNQIE